MKHLCIADRGKRILYASKHYPGKMHDKTMLIAESEEKKISQKIMKLFDLAFLGLESERTERSE